MQVIYGISEEAIKNHLLTGNSLIISTSAKNPGGSYFTGGNHLIAVLDIKQINGGYQVYVANPNPSRSAGWFPISTVVSAASGKWCVGVSR